MVGTIELIPLEGTCRYCGEIRPVMAADQTDADNKITADCDCGGEKKAARKARVIARIEEITGEEATRMGFPAVEEPIPYWLKQAGEMILDGKMDKLSAEIDGTKIVIEITSKGAIKVKRSKTESTTLEV